MGERDKPRNRLLIIENILLGYQRGGGGGRVGETRDGMRSTLAVMSTGRCVELLNYCIVHLQPE